MIFVPLLPMTPLGLQEIEEEVVVEYDEEVLRNLEDET
jgi:hypothetical protein